ncbi:MAG TPA: type II secretion system protein GspM [Polyangiales bacterium]|nr:type II secretion system protein GspM [Polyangiales bacterium]
MLNNPLFERLRTFWENLNDRERRMLSLLGIVFAALLLVFPPVLLIMDNAALEDQNSELRNVVEQLDTQRAKLARIQQERRNAEQRYLNKTPPLGSFLESEAKKQGLTLQEVTDQPEKTVGRFLRRSVTVALPQVALTPLINLLSSIVESGHPVAIDQLSIDHYQPGDQFNVKLGVLTFDKLSAAAAKPEEESGG